jgi:3-dehydroquinate synthase
MLHFDNLNKLLNLHAFEKITTMQLLPLKNYDISIGPVKDMMPLFFEKHHFTKVFILVDEHTRGLCLPYFLQQEFAFFKDLRIIEIASGEHRKSIKTCTFIWHSLMEGGADRHSLMINLGGGVIGDMGGFCAATYMRGIAFVQVPTTLLSMTDASIGGKLGIDLSGLKNLVGVFADPAAVWIDPYFLKSLSVRELRSGLAETIKHAIIADPQLWEMVKAINSPETADWSQLLIPSLRVKQQIVEADPFEKGIRKALNFGHTIGHALETYYLETDTPLLHGEAVALGMMAEAKLAVSEGLLDQSGFEDIIACLKKYYAEVTPPKPDPKKLLQLMYTDKKNKGGKIGFALPTGIGKVRVDCFPEEGAVIDAVGELWQV